MVHLEDQEGKSSQCLGVNSSQQHPPESASRTLGATKFPSDLEGLALATWVLFSAPAFWRMLPEELPSKHPSLRMLGLGSSQQLPLSLGVSLRLPGLEGLALAKRFL